jgi:hypothetical protein
MFQKTKTYLAIYNCLRNVNVLTEDAVFTSYSDNTFTYQYTGDFISIDFEISAENLVLIDKMTILDLLNLEQLNYFFLTCSINESPIFHAKFFEWSSYNFANPN